MSGVGGGFWSGALAAAMAIGMGAAAQGVAQGTGRVDIPASGLPEAAAALTMATGVQVLWQGIGDAARTQPVRGAANADAALDAMLAGTGLGWRRRGAGSVEIIRLAQPGNGEDSVQLPEMQVQGSTFARGGLPPAAPGGQVASGGGLGLLGNRSLMDTPFSMTSFTSELIANQQAQSVGDVVVNDSSIRNRDPSNASQQNSFDIRGFILGSANVGFNGLYGLAPNNQTSLIGIERVEVLKGPSAFLNGMAASGVGGNINLVAKRAGAEPLNVVTLGYLSNGQYGTQVDVGRRFGAAQEYGVRANAIYRNGSTSVHGQSQELGAASLGLDYRGERLRASADFAYQRLNIDRPNQPILLQPGQAVPPPPSPRQSFMAPWNYVDLTDVYGMARVEYDLTPDITVHAAGGMSHTDWQQFLNAGSQLQANGNFTSASSLFLAQLDRRTATMGIQGRFETGPVRHRIDAGADFFQVLRATGSWANPGSLLSNIFRPAFIARPAVPEVDVRKASDTRFYSFAIADTLSVLNERIQLTLGLRQQNVVVDSFAYATGARTAHYATDALTPVIGLVVKPWSNVSLYASYIEALQQGTVVGPTYANAGQVLPPYVASQYEVGVKVEWGPVTTTLAAFEITQQSAIVNAASNTFGVNGEQRNRGLELSVFGEPLRGVRVLGGVTLMDAELTKTAGGAMDGRRPVGVPRVSVSLGAEWDLPFAPGATLAGRLVHTGQTYAGSASNQSVGGWSTVDLGARYRLERAGASAITLRADVRNLFNERYWSTPANGGGLSPGLGTTYLASASFEF